MRHKDIIREPLPDTVEGLGKGAKSAPILNVIQQKYGLTYERYAALRNGLLAKHNGELPLDVLNKELLGSITIDLVASGCLDINIDKGDIRYKLSKNAKALIKRHKKLGTVAPIMNDAQALIFLRNNGYLTK